MAMDKECVEQANLFREILGEKTVNEIRNAMCTVDPKALDGEQREKIVAQAYGWIADDFDKADGIKDNRITYATVQTKLKLLGERFQGTDFSYEKQEIDSAFDKKASMDKSEFIHLLGKLLENRAEQQIPQAPTERPRGSMGIA